jgi:Helix-turn-helix domain
MPNETTALKLMTEKQLAEAIAVSPRTARRLRAQKILPFYKLGKGLIRYDQSQCLKALGKYRVSAHGESRAQN